MRGNFEKCLAEVLKHEGGWADHPKDPGGATMKGVTIGTYTGFLGYRPTKDELRNIPDAHLRDIYRQRYWNQVRGDDLPAGVDMVVFDAAVNSGPSRGAKWLQEAVGGLKVDGVIGPATLARVREVPPSEVIARVMDIREKFLRGLSTWPTFGKGWTRRLIAVESEAVGLMGDVTPSASKGFWAILVDIIHGIFGGR